MGIGQFYFAWVDPGTIFQPDVHNVEDEEVFSFRFTHTEGDFAQCEFDIVNPRVGFLSAGRKQWVMFSFHKSNDDIEPIFFGRVIGVPSNIFGEVVTITCTARPINYALQKDDLVAGLRVAPFWDPLFINPDLIDDPDVVLESRAAHWHIDPVTHQSSISSVFNGEDGTITLDPDEYFDDNMQLTLNQIAATRCILKCSVSWDQTFQGNGYDMMPFILQNFGDPIAMSTQTMTTFTGKGLISSWPQAGASIGSSGLLVQAGKAENIGFTIAPAAALPHWLTANPDDPFFDTPLPAPLPVGSIFFAPKITGNWYSGATAGFSTQYEQAFLPLAYVKGTFIVEFNEIREFTEHLTIELRTSVQPVVTEPGEEDVINIDINGNKASDFIDGVVPIGDTRRRKFFSTARGKQAIKYLLCCARAQMIIKARAAEIAFELPLEPGLEFTLRKNALIENDRLPGGEAVGKIISKELSLDGDVGMPICKITIGCLVGKGEAAYTESVGTPRYGSVTYMGADYQQFNSVVSLIDPAINELAFTVNTYNANDDGLDPTHLTARDLVVSVGVQNASDEQRAQITGAGLIGTIVDNAQISEILQEFFTQVDFEFKNVKGGPFVTEVAITVEDLVLPRQLNLEAA